MTETIQDRARWEEEYESGAWSRLGRDDEFARYRLLAGYIQRGRRDLRLLDMGCGEGLILRHLNLDRVVAYCGVDLAQTALDRIAPRRSQDRYICCSLEEYTPDAMWDIILFNEILYYTADPVPPLQRFEEALRPDGAFVISMFRKRNPLAWNNRCIRRVWRYMRAAGYVIDDAVRLTRAGGPAAWDVWMVRPPRT